MAYTWPLAESNFTLWDKLQLCGFLLNPRSKWTQGDKVEEFERRMAAFVGAKYAVFVSSGSTANNLLAYYVWDTIVRGDKNVVVLPSITWQTSCSPWIHQGFQPVFIDVNRRDFSMDLEKLDKYLSQSADKVACVFITSLIGFVPDLTEIRRLAKKYKVRVMMDNCENTFGSYGGRNINSFFTSTTSTYFAHFLTSVEGGFIFTDSADEYAYFLMNRAHGMTRELDGKIPDKIAAEYRNKLVDRRFDFFSLGNNFRNSNIHAKIGLLDLRRAPEYIRRRLALYHIWRDTLSQEKFYLPPKSPERIDVPFCLPIISADVKLKQRALELCENLRVETRPLISGFLGFQRCFQNLLSPSEHPRAKALDKQTFYIGLNPSLSESKVETLAKILNRI